MKKALFFAIAVCMMMPLSACETNEDVEEPTLQQETPQPNSSDSVENVVTRMKIMVGRDTLTATLDNNATAQAFAAKLPITLPMMDLYGREMCYRFTEALPTDDVRTRGYDVGEIIYYPPMHSFVIMYAQNGERFQMQSIGSVEGNVDIFDGIGDVDVRFEGVDGNND